MRFFVDADACPVVRQVESVAKWYGVPVTLHFLSLPLQVEEFLERLSLRESPYLFAIATCGVPYWGRPFLDADEILARKGRHLHGTWFVRLVSNYLPYRDTAAEWRIRIRARLAEHKLQGIARDIEQKEHHSTWQLLRDMCRRYHEEWRKWQKEIDEKFSCNTAKCISCGFCERICPKKNILRPEGRATAFTLSHETCKILLWILKR